MSAILPPWPPAISGQMARFNPNALFFRSPITGQVQFGTRQAGRWEFDVTLQLLDDTRLKQWKAFLDQVQEQALTFIWNDWPHVQPLMYPGGSGWGTPLVNGANQTGYSLVMKGFSAGATLKAGDCLAFDNSVYREMHRLTADATADGSGNLTASINPKIRRSPADSASILMNGNTGVLSTTMGCEVIVAQGGDSGFDLRGYQAGGRVKLIEVPR